MTKAKEKTVNDQGQMSLFDLLRQDHVEKSSSRSGRLCCSSRLHASLKKAAKDVKKSREQIVDDMTDLLGITISVDMMNNWLSDSHPHRMPAEYYPAFCAATNNTEPLQVLSETAGVYILPPPDALRAETQKIEEEIHRLQKERQKRLLFLQEMEK